MRLLGQWVREHPSPFDCLVPFDEGNTVPVSHHFVSTRLDYAFVERFDRRVRYVLPTDIYDPMSEFSDASIVPLTPERTLACSPPFAGPRSRSSLDEDGRVEVLSLSVQSFSTGETRDAANRSSKGHRHHTITAASCSSLNPLGPFHALPCRVVCYRTTRSRPIIGRRFRGSICR